MTATAWQRGTKAGPGQGFPRQSATNRSECVVALAMHMSANYTQPWSLQMRLSSLFAAVSCSVFAAQACAPAVDLGDDEASQSGEAELSNAADLKLFRAALVGISSSGSEGDAVAYRALAIALKAGDSWNADTLATRIGARIPQIREADARYGYQSFVTGSAMEAYWMRETNVSPDAEDPAAAKVRADRMKALKALCKQKLTNVTHMVVGVRSVPSEPGSIENGAVAPVIVGRLKNGRLIVLYGIDIWT
jgi:hypothetical protein